MSLPFKTQEIPNWTGDGELAHLVWKYRDRIVEHQRGGYIAYKLGPDYERFWTGETRTRIEVFASCELGGIEFIVTERSTTIQRLSDCIAEVHTYEIAPFYRKGTDL